MRNSGAIRRQLALIVGAFIASFGWALLHAGAGRSSGEHQDAAKPARRSPSPDVRDTSWPRYGLDESGTHYSPLNQINAGNVARLGLAWSTDLDSFAGQIEGTPLMVDGTIYATGPWSVRQHGPQTAPHDLGIPGRVGDEMLQRLIRAWLGDACQHGRHGLARTVAEQAVDILAQGHALRPVPETVLELIEPPR